MLHNDKVYHFFMSASTPSGFVSHFPSINCQHRYLLKGPSGSGKSTLIKRAVSSHQYSGVCELIHCSFDKDSLDGAILEESGIAFIDSTPPHTLEPRAAIANDTVISLYDFFDAAALSKNRAEIERLCNEEELLSQKSAAFIRAAGMLLSSNERICARFLDREKLKNFISRLCSREIKKKGGFGEAKTRYLSTLCESGVFMFTDTAKKLCSRLYAIEDKSGAASGIILEAICKAAVSAGYSVYLCPCPLSDSGRIEHLLIPELSLGYLTSNKFHPIKDEGIKKIHTSRFYDCDAMYSYSARTSFQTRAAREMLKEAALLNAKKLKAHTRLESYYVGACDFIARDKYFDTAIAKLP